METERLLIPGLYNPGFCFPHQDGSNFTNYSCSGCAVGGFSESDMGLMGQTPTLQHDLQEPAREYVGLTSGSLAQIFSEEESRTISAVNNYQESNSVETTTHLASGEPSECSGDSLLDSILGELFPELVEPRLFSLCIDDDGSTSNDDLAVDGSIMENSDRVWDDLDMRNWNIEMPVVSNFINSQHMEEAFGIKRTCSEIDITTLGNEEKRVVDNAAIVAPPAMSVAMRATNMEDRRQKLLRYRKKKTERNFGRKIKYACRKALADSQPRVRGRFAKMEDSRSGMTSM